VVLGDAEITHFAFQAKSSGCAFQFWRFFNKIEAHLIRLAPEDLHPSNTNRHTCLLTHTVK